MAHLRVYKLGDRYGYSDLSFFWKYSLQSDVDRATCLVISNRDIAIQFSLDGCVPVPHLENNTIKEAAIIFADSLFNRDGVCCLNALEKMHGSNSIQLLSLIKIMERKLCYLRGLSSVWNRLFVLTLFSCWERLDFISFSIISLFVAFIVFADMKPLAYLRELAIHHVVVFFDPRSIPISHATGIQCYVLSFSRLARDACMRTLIAACIFVAMATAILSSCLDASTVHRWNTMLHAISYVILGLLIPVSVLLDSSPWYAIGTMLFLHKQFVMSILSYLVLAAVVAIAFARDMFHVLRRNPFACCAISTTIALLAFGIARIFPVNAFSVWKIAALLIMALFLPLVPGPPGKTHAIASRVLHVAARHLNDLIVFINSIVAVLIVSRSSVRLGLQLLRGLNYAKHID